jgi:mannose-6-phosphate isomerase-like protein (cupin superfamily)
MKINKFNLKGISEKLTKAWSPIDIESINDFAVRIAKFDGKYHWHKHDNEDELFIVFKGKIKIQTKSEDITLETGEGVKIPKGIEHCTVFVEPSIILMFEPIKLESNGG